MIHNALKRIQDSFLTEEFLILINLINLLSQKRLEK